MTVPFHQYASTPLAIPASLAAERLEADPTGQGTTATAGSLRALARTFTHLGLAPTVLPVTRARVTEADELGAVEIAWQGEESLTGWPALVGHLLVVPESDATSRLVLLSPRSPEADLQTAHLDRLHRLRVVDVTLQRFLQDLATELDGHAASDPSTPVGDHDRTPLFVHHQEATACDPDELRRALTRDAAGLADRATAAVLAHASEVLRVGRFRSVAAPVVEARAATPGELGVIRIGWRADEEATGWPEMELLVVVAARAVGTDLCVLSSREPGYDLSRNRIDRHQRDQLLRQAGAGVATALLGELSPQAASAEPTVEDRSLVTSGAVAES
ncbi:MAG: hypothetical protein WD638_06650 [Nitriliruptoraceae bacterium]